MSDSIVLKDKSARRSLKNATILIHEDTAMKIKEELPCFSFLGEFNMRTIHFIQLVNMLS